MTPVVAALLFATSNLSGGPTSISFSPSNPKPGEPVTIAVQGAWTDSCVPRPRPVTVKGRTITIEGAGDPCGFSCLAALTPYSFTVTLIAPSEPGQYVVEYYSIEECQSRRAFEAAATLNVADKCEFGRALTADRASARVGKTFNLNWCDPSYFLGVDAAFNVNFYRVFSSRSATGPFTQIAELQRASTTTYQRSEPDAGTRYYYVEAHGCSITIAGSDCPSRETVTLSNIVSVAVVPDVACMPNLSTLCLSNSRFEVTAHWRAADGREGFGRAVSLTSESGYFWFFNDTNVEVTTKLLNACPANFWFFASGMTNVEVELTVRDRVKDAVKQYKNPLGTAFVPILDTAAFRCP